MKLEKEIAEIKATLARIELVLVCGTRETKVHFKDSNAPRPKIVKDIDFDLPERAFFNRYAQNLSGPERFALMVAYLAKGDVSKEILSRDVEDRWSKMTSFLGIFNRAHPTRAKDRDLVNSPKKGIYHLRPNWREILQ